MKLVERLEVGAHHVVAMVGYFSSVQLAEDLLKKGLYVIGTTRHNRLHSLPAEASQAALR